MYLSDGELVVSASDLNNYTACRHLLRLNLEARDRKVLEKMLAKISPMLGVKVDH